jgi:hypothetical protein
MVFWHQALMGSILHMMLYFPMEPDVFLCP